MGGPPPPPSPLPKFYGAEFLLFLLLQGGGGIIIIIINLMTFFFLLFFSCSKDRQGCHFSSFFALKNVWFFFLSLSQKSNQRNSIRIWALFRQFCPFLCFGLLVWQPWLQMKLGCVQEKGERSRSRRGGEGATRGFPHLRSDLFLVFFSHFSSPFPLTLLIVSHLSPFLLFL